MDVKVKCTCLKPDVHVMPWIAGIHYNRKTTIGEYYKRPTISSTKTSASMRRS